jgi:hypothetical protein
VEGDAAPHAQHIHFGEEARHECPTMDEAGDDDKLDTTEGAPAYGPVAVSLTTEGDTSPDSTLAVERFPAGGTIEYDRDNIEVSADLAEAIARGEGVVVIHGVDYDDSGKYDGDEKSDLSRTCRARRPTRPCAASERVRKRRCRHRPRWRRQLDRPGPGRPRRHAALRSCRRRLRGHQGTQLARVGHQGS